MNIIAPNPTNPITALKGFMTSTFSSWAQLITDEQILIGTGSPEGVIEAKQGRQYMDDTGTTGNIFYVKRDADIAGDRTSGWILV